MKELKIKWERILSSKNPKSGPIYRWINLGNGTMFRIGAFFTSSNQNTRLGLFIALERIGAFLFPINRVIHYAYVSEKLSIPESDARALADWINVQLGYEVDQQGHYSIEMITEYNHLSYPGELPTPLLSPFIVGENENAKD